MNENKIPGALQGPEFRFDAFDDGRVLFNKKKKRLPAMGWNSWNAFGSGNTEELTKAMAEKIVELGLDKLGYKYVVLDDGCYLPERIDGKLANENTKFQSGFKALGDFIHDKGLKFGMYNDIGTNLCAGAAVGTYGHEATDARSYLEWGVDFIKVDNCYYMWDNATFSNPENARFVYAPRIRSIKLVFKDKEDRSNEIKLYSAIDGIACGDGVKISGEGTSGFAENIGTFDGTNTGTSPVGVRSGELTFEVDIPEEGEYDLFIEYASGKNPQGSEAGVGEWLQVAVDKTVESLWTDKRHETHDADNTERSLIIELNYDGSPSIDTRVAEKEADDLQVEKINHDIIKSTLYFDGLLPESPSKDEFILSDAIKIYLKSGMNTIRLMNHRRQENTLNSYAELLKEFNKSDPDNDVILSICEWGKTQPQNWGYKVGDSWRILNDITFWVGRDGDPGVARWFDPGTPSVTSQYNKAVVMDEYAGLDKGWNDPDMMMIGMNGITDVMCRTHFTMWCMMNSPLMLGLDLRRVQKDDWIYRIIANKELIDINQDSLGIQAKRVYTSIKTDRPDKDYITNNDRVDILVKPLSDGSAAVSFINVGMRTRDEGFELNIEEIPFEGFIKGLKYEMKDLWSEESCINENGIIRVDLLEACDNKTFRVKAVK